MSFETQTCAPSTSIILMHKFNMPENEVIKQNNISFGIAKKQYIHTP